MIFFYKSEFFFVQNKKLIENLSAAWLGSRLLQTVFCGAEYGIFVAGAWATEIVIA